MNQLKPQGLVRFKKCSLLTIVPEDPTQACKLYCLICAENPTVDNNSGIYEFG